MYQHFYGFTQKPFDVTPDPKFLYMSRNHEETLAAIIYGIRERRGFITIIGEVGTGKTTLLNATLEKLDNQTASAFIFNTDVSFEELLQMALIEFGLSTAEELLPKFVALERLNRFATEQFAAGKNIVIIIDEAQNLDLQTMENLRLLSNLETPRHKLVQIVLSGQPELDEKLRRQEMRQFSQRINLRRYITPLDKTNTYQYVRHHLRIAGCLDTGFFDKPSLELIWKYSGGVPRKINILCDNVLLIGYGLGKRQITRSEIQEAIRDLSWSPFPQAAAKSSELNPIMKKRTAAYMITRVAAIAACLLLALIMGALTGTFWDLKSDTLGFIPAFSRHLQGTAIGLRSSETTPQKDSIGSDIQGQNFQIISPKTEPHTPDLTTEHSAPPNAAINQNVETHQTEAKHFKPETIQDNTNQQAFQAVILQQKIEEPSPGLRKETGDQSSGESFNQIIVKKGDTLSWILKDIYGDSEEMLPLVLEENSQIQNPDRIFPGWIIRLPKNIQREKLAGRMKDIRQSAKSDRISLSSEQ